MGISKDFILKISTIFFQNQKGDPRGWNFGQELPVVHHI
jgi:hypothetical protein